MPPRKVPVPGGTFASHSKHLQQRLPGRRFASQRAAPEHPLWRGPDPFTRMGQTVTGSMEWQTSTYSFNKNHNKLLPVAASNVQKLIECYATMKKIDKPKGKGRHKKRGERSEEEELAWQKELRAAQAATNRRRKIIEKIYVSKPRVKDFGDRIELTAFFYDGADKKKAYAPKWKTQEDPSSGSDFLFDPAHQAPLARLIARIYDKPVDLKFIKLSRPHLDADILAAYVAHQLKDRKNGTRRVIRDAAWNAPLPTQQAVDGILQAKHQRLGNQFTWSDLTLGNSVQTTASSIMDQIAVSQVSSIEIGAAGRLTKRLTADRTERKVVRRGTSTKMSGTMLRGFRKAQIQKGFAGAKRRVGQFGVRVSIGHA